ncbi:putative ABC transporter ATP-binding protein [Flammeovirgaceae bacterium 311]|nr:putative ABC transporter ATP-binding protein [Flammeovirgaceae bacterium 311]
MENQPFSLSIRNISKTYPGGRSANGVKAFSNINLTIPAGMYGLLGSNGAGKSTLMHTLATLQEPDAGSINLGVLDVLNQKEEVRQTHGYLPQEPTASLDPAERVRFLNLLSELSENSLVILSTHIVEDVAELCTNIANINEGKILLEAKPLQATAALKGKIWRKLIDKNSINQLEQEHKVISAKLLSGRTLVHVYNPENPGGGFEPVEPDLEDVYFSTMTGHYIPTHQETKTEEATI